MAGPGASVHEGERGSLSELLGHIRVKMYKAFFKFCGYKRPPNRVSVRSEHPHKWTSLDSLIFLSPQAERDPANGRQA